MIANAQLFGITVDELTRQEFEDRVLKSLALGIGGWAITANLDHLRRLSKSPELRLLVADADVVLADGAPLVWASRIARCPLPERVAGSDLIWTLTARAAEAGRSVFLLGGSPGSAERAAQRLAFSSPQLRVAGTYCPDFGFEHSASAVLSLEQAVADARPDIIYVGLGFPKQDQLIARIRGSLPNAWFIGCGQSIDFTAGTMPRAPHWMQPLGIEWIHRLSREPRRLFPRYIVYGIPFAAELAWRAARLRYRPDPNL